MPAAGIDSVYDAVYQVLYQGAWTRYYIFYLPFV
jgi:hypothetical protein